MEFVKITKNGETKTVEKGAVSLWAMRGWVLVTNEDSPYRSTKPPFYKSGEGR